MNIFLYKLTVGKFINEFKYDLKKKSGSYNQKEFIVAIN